VPELPFQPLRLRVLWAGLAVGLVLAAALCWSLASQHFVAGSAAGGWSYPYVRVLNWLPVMTALACGAAAALLLWIPIRTTGAGLALVAVSIVVATPAHAFLRTAAPFDLETIFRSPGANAFHTFAQEVGPSELLGRFERARRQAPLHAQSNMPGKTLLVHALERLTTDTAVLPWLLVILSNLGALLVFALARELSGDVRVGLYSSMLYLFTPGRLYFLPIMNTVTPFLVLAFLWVIVRWLRSQSTITGALAGVLLFGLVLFEPLPLVIGLLVVALAAAAILRGELTVTTFVVQSAAMGAFFVLTAVLFYEATGFHLLNAFRRIGEHAVEFNETAGRPYSVWVVANLREFALSAGPASLALAAALPLAGATAGSSLRSWVARPHVVSSLGLFAVLIVTNLLGINRGEVVRLWIFLACLFQIPAAWACAALGTRWATVAVLAAAILQAAIGIATIGFVVP
jgi:hypothetical protein